MKDPEAEWTSGVYKRTTQAISEPIGSPRNLSQFPSLAHSPAFFESPHLLKSLLTSRPTPILTSCYSSLGGNQFTPTSFRIPTFYIMNLQVVVLFASVLTIFSAPPPVPDELPWCKEDYRFPTSFKEMKNWEAGVHPVGVIYEVKHKKIVRLELQIMGHDGRVRLRNPTVQSAKFSIYNAKTLDWLWEQNLKAGRSIEFTAFSGIVLLL
ncbi:hypothetical protein MJO29_007536 [Puccinia striiformis f. sp. tritici]|uniref:hypothetical protein n=1 Tax=Puccinia striiformis f. sp. tritici TaxID=168172 RepID=UPI0020081F26|nr:hypothetical protein Pst134EA_013706 [Puccinia striiformis f. sp. tritici]KAH9465841.1 hypothetical protein Pst134EA_013706 [Puccinia striiformis f. sp. tritici]KAI7956137.1 hypothetical protein MJO29_007536 [Puccinia striiformis f. sp. tritici]